MMKKKTVQQNRVNKDGFIEVPTYLFPQGEEYSDDLMTEDKDSYCGCKNKKKKNK